METETKTLLYNGKRCSLRVGHHGHSGLILSVIVVDEKNGFTLKPLTRNVGELVTTHTSNSISSKLLPIFYSYVTPEAQEFIESNGLGVRVAYDASPEGYLLYSFNKSKLKQYDPKGCDSYKKEYLAKRMKIHNGI